MSQPLCNVEGFFLPEVKDESKICRNDAVITGSLRPRIHR